MADPAATPWVFRYRSLLIGIVFLAAWLIGKYLGTLPFFAAQVGLLSLPADLLLNKAQVPVGSPWPLAIPVVLGLAGAALRWWGTSYLRGHVMADKHMHSDRLIIAGPFRFVRNPLYVGNFFIAAAYGLYFPPPALVVAVVLMVAVLAVVAHAEAEGLRRQHGAAYDAYAKRVHAFLPTLRPAAATATVQPDWINGLSSELWGALMPVYLAALVLRQDILAFVVLGIILAGLFYRRVVNQKARQAPPS